MSSQPETSSTPPTEKPALPWVESNGVYATYDLHCHCGAIRYTMTISPPLYEEHAEGRERSVAVDCGCSACERHGNWAVHPLAKDVTWTRGLEDRMEYYTGQKKNPHLLCRKCGCLVGIDLSWLMGQFQMEPRYSINAKMLKDFDRKKLLVRRAEEMSQYPPKYSID